ncbi:DoxX family protein [Candidatus Woesearchaeota archaeon]|nr:MAG: DoxX family protein [Candidatus Woesearchaeota archaeon]
MKYLKYISPLNRVLLGLVMFVAGGMKLLVSGPDNVSGMLSGIGFPAPLFFAWVLIVFEILCGAAIIMNWNIKYAVIPPMIILLVASFTVHISNVSNLLIHLALTSNYALIAVPHWKKK